MHTIGAEHIGVRYRLESIIGKGGMGTVYLALDRLTSRKVALKRVRATLDELGFSSKGKGGNNKLALVKEFRVLSSLRHPYIIDVLDYGFDEKNAPFFTMEFLETGIPIKAYAAFATKEEILNRVVEMLQVLVYLHRRGILHRDIKPSNILVVNGHIKILDFGLAKSMQARSSEYSKDNIAGTMAYMAPELFKGDKVSQASDLYAAGLLAYELLSGQFPFRSNNLAHLAYEIMNTSPDLMLLDGLSDEVIDVIDRLVVKDPIHRYQQASEALRDLQQALDYDPEKDSMALRESFLQSARFVGRDHELKTLREAMKNATEGIGSTWLIGGESGVGKTRLLEELRSRALAQGVTVWRGQVSSERQQIFHSWREVARHLCIEVELTGLEAQVLKLLVPDIEDLIDVPVEDAPPIQPQAASERLLQVIEALFRKLPRPAIVVLEDLHWSREGISIIKHLSQTIEELPLMLIGTFRNDERPGLPEEIPHAEVLILQRLNTESIRELSESMLGVVYHQEILVDMLSRETEGNALFIVEVVRTLAEEAGQLDRIGQITLPEHVFTKGIQTVMQRRLENVPDHAVYPLQLAAIIGREIELTILSQALPDYDWQRWLAICSDLAVITAEGYRWYFSHEKLRKSVLEMLPDMEVQALATEVALAAEVVYGNVDQYAALFVHLWGLANNATREIHYLWLAAMQLYEVSNIREMRQYLQRALELAKTASIDDLLRWKMEVKLGEAHVLMSDVSAAVTMLENLVEVIPVTIEPEIVCVKSEVYYQLAFSAINLGEYEKGLQFARDGLEIVIHCPDLYQRTRILWIMGMANLFNSQYEAAQEFYDQCLELSLQIDDKIFIMSSYIGMGSLALMQNNLERGIEYGELAYNLAVESGNYLYQEYALHNQGALYVASGYPELGLERLEEASALAKKLNILPALALSQINMAIAYIMLDQLSKALELIQYGVNLALAVDGTPTVLLGIITYGRWIMAKHSDRERAVSLFVYGLEHPKTQMDDVVWCEELLRDFEVTDEEFAVAQSSAALLEFDQLVSEILGQ